MNDSKIKDLNIGETNSHVQLIIGSQDKYRCGMIRYTIPGDINGDIECSSEGIYDRGWFKRIHDYCNKVDCENDQYKVDLLNGYSWVMSFGLACGIGWILAGIIAILASLKEKRIFAIISVAIFSIVYILFIVIFSLVWTSVRNVQDYCKSYLNCDHYKNETKKSSREFLGYCICDCVLILIAIIFSLLGLFSIKSVDESYNQPPGNNNEVDHKEDCPPVFDHQDEYVNAIENNQASNLYIGYAVPIDKDQIASSPAQPMPNSSDHVIYKNKQVEEAKLDQHDDPISMDNITPIIAENQTSKALQNNALPNSNALPCSNLNTSPITTPAIPVSEIDPDHYTTVELKNSFRIFHKYITDPNKLVVYGSKKFDEIDTDHSGTIVRIDFKPLVIKIMKTNKLPILSDQRINELLKHYGLEHNATLEKNEFEKLFYDLFIESREILAKKYAEQKVNLWKSKKILPIKDISELAKFDIIMKDNRSIYKLMDDAAASQICDRKEAMIRKQIISLTNSICTKYKLPKLTENDLIEIMRDIERPITMYDEIDQNLAGYVLLCISRALMN